MRKIIPASIIALAALVTVPAQAMDNPAQNAQAKVQALWGKGPTVATGWQVSASRVETERSTLSVRDYKGKGTNGAYARLKAVQPSQAGR